MARRKPFKKMGIDPKHADVVKAFAAHPYHAIKNSKFATARSQLDTNCPGFQRRF